MERSRILVVEDHQITADMMERLLASSGFDVRTASTVRDALQACRDQRFDLLLCDLGLPDGSANDLLPQVRQLYPVRAIACSGYGTAEDVAAARAAGFDEYVLKPTQVATLLHIVSTLLADQTGSAASDSAAVNGVRTQGTSS